MQTLDFTQPQLIDFYTGFLQYLADQNPNPVPNSEQEQLYGQDKININLLLRRIMNSGTCKCVVDAAMVLIFRVLSQFSNSLEIVTNFNIHRLLASALIVANISFEDDTILLSRWQRSINYIWSLEMIKSMVVEFLSLLQYKLMVNVEETDMLWTNVLYPYYKHELQLDSVVQFIQLQGRLIDGEIDFIEKELDPQFDQKI